MFKIIFLIIRFTCKSFYEFILTLILFLKEIYLFIKEDFIRNMKCEIDDNKEI
ncbi:hypothetical protein CP118TE_31660 (plasmid) [Clostridium perfringens E]|nr:hypothetical protein CP118TE_31660 [Clostridium perfringens E]